MLILGLCRAHGSNRTGRPFTGDGSGAFMFPLLYEVAGFASQPESISRGDGMRLHDAWMSAVVRCAPPDNRPLPSDVVTALGYLDGEAGPARQSARSRVPGKIAFDGFVAHLRHPENGNVVQRYSLPDGGELPCPVA